MKILATVVLSLCLGSTALSQLRNISLEAGSLINTPNKSVDKISDNGRSTQSFEITTKYKKSTGYFAKGSVEFDLAKRGNWSLYMPMGIELNQNVVETEREGYSWGCFGGGEINEHQKMTFSLIGCFVGVGVEHSSRKWQSSLALNLHNSVIYKYDHVITQPDFPTTHHTKKFAGKEKYVSGQLSLLYKFDERFAIGPTCAVYFCDLNMLVAELKAANNENNQKVKINMKQGGDNIWICPGFKFRYHL